MATKKSQAPEPDVFDWGSEEMAGFENVTQADLGIPFLQIVQKMSPEAEETSQKFIPGAKAGDIINTATRMVLPRPVMFVPCNYQRMYVEWTPRDSGGGFVAAHKLQSILEGTHRNAKGQDVLPNGNLIVTTAYIFGMVEAAEGPERAVIGFSSTQLKKARQFLTLMMSIKLERSNGEKFTPPMFSHKYALTTVPEKNEKGSWMGWRIESAGMTVDRALIDYCRQFQKVALTAMAVRTALPEASAVEDDDLL